jgi:hypothetical protein
MIITFNGGGNFKIKCKDAIITTGDSIKINNFSIDGPGEYEVAGISAENIDGITNIYVEDMNITYLKKNKSLTNEELEKVEGTDVLFLPVGEIIDPKIAVEVANQIEPKILILMHYKSVDELQQIKGLNAEIMDELKLSKNALSQEERHTIALNIHEQ